MTDTDDRPIFDFDETEIMFFGCMAALVATGMAIGGAAVGAIVWWYNR